MTKKNVNYLKSKDKKEKKSSLKDDKRKELSKPQKASVLTLTVTDMDSYGNGILYDDLDRRIVVKNLIKGDTAKIKIISRKEFGFIGELIEITKNSDDRTAPFCSVFGKCGGCNIQHMSYEAQKVFKTALVRKSMKRFAKREINVLPIIGMENPFYYRNKVQYPIGFCVGRINIGFYEDKTYKIVPNKGCFIQHKEADKIKEILLKHLIKHRIEPYNYETSSGIARYLMTRKGFATDEIMVIIVLNSSSLPGKDEFIKNIITEVPNVKSIIINSNYKNTNVILGEQNSVIYGSNTIRDIICGIKFDISPNSFFQTNPLQTEILYQKLKEIGAFRESDIVFDFYSGIGSIALSIAGSVKKVFGIELNKQAVKDAKHNAELNNISNAEFIVGKSENAIYHLFKAGVRADKIILDPPRDGCDKNLLKQIAGSKIPEIIYVSCNHETLARDLGIFADLGYKTEIVQPVDMFPHTIHVECIAKIVRI